MTRQTPSRDRKRPPFARAGVLRVDRCDEAGRTEGLRGAGRRIVKKRVLPRAVRVAPRLFAS